MTASLHSPRKKMKLSIKDFFSNYDQIRRKMRIWSHLLKKSLMENFIFYAVLTFQTCKMLLVKYINIFVHISLVWLVYGTKYSRMAQVKFVEDSL